MAGKENNELNHMILSQKHGVTLSGLGMLAFLLSMYTPGMTAVGNVGLALAFISALLAGALPLCLATLRTLPVIFIILLIGWFGLGYFWSLMPEVTITDVVRKFDDYLWLMVPIVFLSSHSDGRRKLMLGMGLAGCAVVAINLRLYWIEYRSGAWGLDPFLHREWSEPLLLYFPFSIALAFLVQGRWKWFWLGLIPVQMIMLIGTAARGAWLGMLAAIMVWIWMAFNVRQRVVAVLSGLLLFAIVSVVFPHMVVQGRIAQGFDTSERVAGTWGPSLEMMNERPLTGWGFGRKIYNQAFNERAPTKSSWTIKESIGPHSIYFETGFAGGYPALGILVLLFSTLILQIGRLLQKGVVQDELKYWYLAGLSSFIAYYVVRGAVESLRWGVLCILVLMLAAPLRNNRSES